MEYIKEFIKPELMLLIPVLYLLGKALKQSPIKDWLIPYILGASGAVLALAYVLSKVSISSFPLLLEAIFTAVTQGVLVAGASVYVENLIKQAKKSKEDKNE